MRWGGAGYSAEDFWYDEEEITVFEGDTCPQCNDGKMKISRNNKLYCSAICWIDEEETPETVQTTQA